MENKSLPLSQPSLGFYEIIRESLKTTSRNGKLLVQILLLMFLSLSLLDFAQEYTLEPFTKYFMWHFTNHPNLVHDLIYNINQTSHVGVLDILRDIVLVRLLIMTVSSIYTLAFLVATVSSSSEAYTAKVLGPTDMLLKIRKSWNRTIFTSFYLILLTCGLAFFYAIFIAITAFLAVNSWALFFFGVITLSIPVCYFYVVTLWMVSLIVSVVEEGSSGLKAIWRAAELMKGKRLRATLMMVLFTLAYGFVVLIAKVLPSYNSSLTAVLAITIPFTNGFYCALKIFMFVVYTVSYHEWKTSHDARQGKGFYLPIVDGEV